jgi:hypothetical protein
VHINFIKVLKNHPKDIKAHTQTHRCYNLGMPKNISARNELKKVNIKWPQLVGDKNIQKTHRIT